MTKTTDHRESSNELKALKPGELATTAAEINAMSPIQQMAQAKQMGMSVTEMKEMLELQKDWEANEARKAFHAALAEFKRNPPKIVKDKMNAQYDGAAYVSIGNMVTNVSEAMGLFGLSARWEFPPGGEASVITVTCILSHTLGHEESVTLGGPIDTSGAKNALQGRRSARTYLKLETFEAVTGMASVAGNVDDDGNTSGPPIDFEAIERITEEQANLIHSKITDNELRMDLFMNWLKTALKTMGVENIGDIPADLYQRVMDKVDQTIKKKRDKEQDE